MQRDLGVGLEAGELDRLRQPGGERVRLDGLRRGGFTVYGGRNAPYVWLRTPEGSSSWDFFAAVLQKAQVVGVPGSGFGPSGEGYVRFSAFGSRAETEEAVERITTALR